MKKNLALCQRVVSAVAENLGSPLALRAMTTALGQELGACAGLVYGLSRDGRFRLVESFGVDLHIASTLGALDPRGFLPSGDFSDRIMAVRADLNPHLEALPSPTQEGSQSKLGSAFFIPVTHSGLLVGCLLVVFFLEQRDDPFHRAAAHAAAFATFHLISEEPDLVLGSR